MPLLVPVLLLQTATARLLLAMPATVQTQVLAVMQVPPWSFGVLFFCEQQRMASAFSRLLAFVTRHSA